MKPTGLDPSKVTDKIDHAQTDKLADDPATAATSSKAKPPQLSSRATGANASALPPTSARNAASPFIAPTLSPRAPTVSTRGSSQRQIAVQTHTGALSTSVSPASGSPSSAPVTTLTTTSGITTNITPGVMTSVPPVMAPEKKPMEPADLAKHLIQAESDNGKLKLEESKVAKILRETVKLDGVNIIEHELKPFMKQHFENNPLETKRNEVAQAYSEMQPQIATLYADAKGGKDFAKDPKAVALMEPVIVPIMDFLFGKDRTIMSSGWPNAILELFWAVDDEIVVWFNKNGSGVAADLQLTRQNALISFFGTRSFMPAWTLELTVGGGKPPQFYNPLLSFTNSYLNFKLTDFAQQIMDCDDSKKRKQLLRQKELVSRRPKPTEKIQQTAGPTSPRASVSAGAGAGLKDNARRREIGVSRQMTQPEKKQQAESASPGTNLSSGAAMKENDFRLFLLEKARRKEVDTYCAQIQLPLKNLEFFTSFKNAVLGLELETYREVKKNWDAFCLQSLSLFIAEKENAGQKIAHSLLTVRDDLKEKVKNASDS